MRELERHPQHSPARATTTLNRVAIVGPGRLGRALAAALTGAGITVAGPFGRGADPIGVDAVLLCVPDAEIARAARLLSAGVPVGHCSGATGLEVLPGPDAFSMHPLMTVTESADGTAFTGAGAAVAGATPEALVVAASLARALGMRPIEVAAPDRAVYHAAASMASNFLITIEAAAERLAQEAGLERAQLVPLVRATVENWARLGPEQALTGPVARGDEPTIERQRQAISDRAPELLALFDALVRATRALAASRPAPAGAPAEVVPA